MSLASSTDTAGPGTSAPITRSQEQPVSIRPMSLRPAGIMRHRPRPVPQQEEVIQSAALTDSRTDALITNFIVGSGLPYEIVNDPIFTELLSYMNPRCVLPTPKLIEACAEKMGNPGKPIVNYQKTQGPLSVTLHVTDTNHKKYLAFSIHYFNETRHRRNVIYLRELLLSKLDENNLLTTLRRAVSAYNYANVKFTNLVVSNDELYALLHRSGVVKRTFVCFYKYVSQFVEKILAFDDFASGLEQLRTFITVVKKDPDAYSKFRRMQLTKNAELDLPALDNSVWESTMVFLTRCLILHETFTEFSERCNIEIYISHAVFNQLVILQRVLQKCVACSRELSTKTSSISQVIPALLGLRSFIASAWGQNSLWKDVREGFTEVFSPLTSGSQAQRYDIATLLDPRYAYNESIYAQQVWTSIEKKLTRDFTVFDRVPNSERNFNVDLSSVGKDERIRILTTEFKLYRQLIIGVRPDDNDDPFSWWSRRSSDLEYLSVFAREFLACPAVSIDADYYFANGGKFSHLCYTYNHQLVENCLNAAGIHQEFRGRGASVDFIQPRQIDQLNTIANRRQKELNIKRFDGVDRSSSKDEYDRLMQSEYPPPPTVSEILKRPKIMDRDLSPSLVVKQELSPDNEVKPMTESNPVFKLTPSELGRGASITERYLAQNRPIKKMFRVVPPENPRQKPQIVQITNPSQLKPTPAEPTKEEKPKDLLNDLELKDIKEEPLDEDDVQAPVSAPVPQPSVQTPKPYSIKVRTPTNTSQISDSSAYLRGGVFTSTPQTRYSNNAAPKPSIASGVTFPKDRPLPQTVAPANFVQKYAQTQKFVQKFVVRKPQIQTLPGSVHELKHNGQNWKKNIFHQSEEKPETLAFYASKPGLPARNSLLRNTFDCFDDFDDSDEEVSHSRDSTFNEVLNRMHSERMYMPQPKKPCNRRCAVCNSMEEHDKLKNVTIDTEKLMIVLGAAYRNEMSIMEARSCLCRVTKTYMCRVHFAEACDEICKMLRVKCPDEIATCTQDRINTALITVVQIRGRSMTVPELRKCLLNFTNKYWEEPAPTRSAAQLALFEEPAEDNDVVEQDIIPKTFRQPRKQVLEEDHDSTVKLIEQEDFKLPQTKPSDGSSSKKFENPETCCFCSEPNDRVNMIRVPRSEDRIARWLHALGQEFQSRLKPIVENYICRSHFSENAFSSRGRLLKGMLPHVQPEKVEVTYKIQGSSFLKLDEQKSGTDKNARLNLDNRKRKRMVSESDDNDDEQDEQEIEESCKVEEESDNEYEYAEIEREEGDNTSPSQEPDSASQEPESRVNVESKHEDSRESSSAKSDSIPSKKAKVVKAPTRISARLSKK